MQNSTMMSQHDEFGALFKLGNKKYLDIPFVRNAKDFLFLKYLRSITPCLDIAHQIVADKVL